MSSCIKYLLYLGMSIFVSVGVFIVAKRPTPTNIAFLVFDVTNWVWVYKLMTAEE